jgi:hypothetical protein
MKRTPQHGTSANSEGEYQLKLNPGKHTIIFKAIGFSTGAENLICNQISSFLSF